MLRSSVLLGAGILLFHQLAELPGWPLLLLGIPLVVFAWRAPATRPWLLPVAGFLWAFAHALLTMPAALPVGDDRATLTLEGRIVSLVERRGGIARFLFQVDRIDGGHGRHDGDWRLRLAWREAAALHPGQRWQLVARVRAVHGFASPGAWDYEGWLYRQGVRYTGYVLSDQTATLIADNTCCRVDRYRAAIGSAIRGLPLSEFARGVVTALVTGDRGGVDGETRALFRATGTSHLMAISGLHIGLAAGLGFALVGRGWRSVPALVGRVPASLAGAIAGLLVATLYALLAGLTLPTQRALVMLVAATVALAGRRLVAPAHTLALAAMLVLLCHPPSVVDAGFWLSFGAVAAILALLQRDPGAKRWRAALRVQLGLTLALWPVLTVFGLPVPLVGPIANLLMVPLFGLLIVPLSLIGVALLMVSPATGKVLLGGLGLLLDLVERLLHWLDALALPILDAAPAPIALVAGTVGVVLLLAPPGLPLRRLAFPLLACAWLPRAESLQTGEFALHVLDVGQGLSVVIETRRHTLVFDTGPRFASGRSTAGAVVVPFLASRGRGVIDRLVVSHGDRDHAGGLDELQELLPVRRVQSGEPDRVGLPGQWCRAGQAWRWDDVSFAFLHPPAGHSLTGNDASCVLRVDNGDRSVLLTGDVGARMEQLLVQRYGSMLTSDIVIAAHHGSRSSSSPAFVAATRPAVVVYTSGWANRYGFPAPEVDRRWAASGAQRLDTATAGTISFELAGSGDALVARCHRVARARFWQHRPGAAGACHAVSSPHP